MLGSPQALSAEALELHYLRFFNQLFNNVEQEIWTLPQETSYEDFALSWHKKMDNRTFREELYSKVI